MECLPAVRDQPSSEVQNPKHAKAATPVNRSDDLSQNQTEVAAVMGKIVTKKQ